MEKQTKHHIIAQELNGTSHPDNITMLDRKLHDCVHTLFGNDPTYHILRRVTERYKPTMDSQVYEMINGVLRQVEHTVEAYNPNCYRGTELKKFLKK